MIIPSINIKCIAFFFLFEFWHVINVIRAIFFRSSVMLFLLNRVLFIYVLLPLVINIYLKQNNYNMNEIANHKLSQQQ